MRRAATREASLTDLVRLFRPNTHDEFMALLERAERAAVATGVLFPDDGDGCPFFDRVDRLLTPEDAEQLKAFQELNVDITLRGEATNVSDAACNAYIRLTEAAFAFGLAVGYRMGTTR